MTWSEQRRAAANEAKQRARAASGQSRRLAHAGMEARLRAEHFRAQSRLLVQQTEQVIQQTAAHLAMRVTDAPGKAHAVATISASQIAAGARSATNTDRWEPLRKVG